MKTLNGKQIKRQRIKYLQTQRDKVWEQPTIEALKSYADSIDGFYQLYVDYRDDLSDWIVEQYNDWNGKGSFIDVISEEIYKMEMNNEDYVIDYIYSEIKYNISDELLEKYEDEIDDYIIDNKYDFFSVGYNWSDFPCSVDVYIKGCTDFIKRDIAESEIFSDYISDEYCSRETDVYYYLTESQEEYQTQKDEISGLDEVIDFIEDCTAKNIDFNFNYDEYYYLFDDSCVDTINEVVEMFNDIVVIDWDTHELKKYNSIEELCKTIRVPLHSVYEDDGTVCIENKLGFQYHLDYDEISKITSNIEYKKEVINNVLVALAKRKADSVNLRDIDTSKIWISFNDSLSSGNCKFGTNEFCVRNNIDTNKIGGIRADYLLDIERSSFTERAVKYKYTQMVA